jgi:type II secretory pathway pseudopilin PulG
MVKKCNLSRQTMKKAAFTLLELLVVIGIIMLLAGLLFPALNAAREAAKKTKAKADVKQLDTAWKCVLLDYRTWALAADSPKAGAVPTRGSVAKMDDSAVKYLQGGSSKGVIYMEFDRSSTNANGFFVDPWHNYKTPTDNTHAYMVYLGDGTVVPDGGVTLYRDVAAWSLGKDTVATKDDIVSW